MIVAWHEMPGHCPRRSRPVGYGLIVIAAGLPSRKGVSFRLKTTGAFEERHYIRGASHTAPYGMDRYGTDFHALRARLLSCRPSGTKTMNGRRAGAYGWGSRASRRLPSAGWGEVLRRRQLEIQSQLYCARL